MRRLLLLAPTLLPPALAAPLHAAHAHPARPHAAATRAAPQAAPLPGQDQPPPPRSTAPYAVTVDATPAHLLNTFTPQTALGVAVDGVPTPAVPQIYTPSNVTKMLGAGLGTISYRLYTELSVQDWHWNPAGAFSQSATQGYWTSSTALGAPTVNTYGYRLPRRGFTTDQGNNDDYSRLDDGDLTTFWKSNPYLTQAYTGEPDALHPQWVLYDLGSAKTVNAARITWANPYATAYQIQYWTGDDPIYDPANGAWVTFPNGAITGAAGGTVTLSLGATTQKTEYLRILMTQSSATCTTPASTDPRDCAGYAIAEAGFGTITNGAFTDLATHAPNQNQTITYASSVDPWHSAANRVTDQEQPGLDTVFNSGLTRNLPAIIPVPVVYSTPANAAAEITYLEARGDKIGLVELGEEVDGQYALPEDYAALYIQFATALHAVDPALKLGGPVFESNLTDLKTWPDATGQTSWTKRFIAYLTSHGHLQDLSFFSFEHYPFASCGTKHTQANLLREPALMQNILKTWRADNLPTGLPIYVTETNYSQNETDAAQLPAGAIWYADMVGTLLANGGAGATFYEYEPIPLSPSNPCPGWGSYGLLLGNGKYAAQQPVSQFFAARVLTQDWALNPQGAHSIFPATAGAGYVTAYPLQRPDGSWSVLLVNRDLTNPHQVTITFNNAGTQQYFTGNLARTDFGATQYSWVTSGPRSHALPDGPELHSTATGGVGAVYTLPAAGITVLSGTIK